MKKVLLALSLILLAIHAPAEACSIAHNQSMVQNDHIHAVALEFRIPLVKVTSLQATGFAYRLYGYVEGSSCEAFLEYTTQVTINYQPNLLEACELTVHVTQTIDMHAETLPFETYTFATPSSSCTRRPLVIREPRLPRPLPLP